MGFVLLVDVDQDRGERLGSCGVVDEPRMEAPHPHRLEQIDHTLARRFLIASNQHIAGDIHVGLQVRRRHIL